MLINAQALINMARKRLCNKSHIATIEVMKEIKKQVNYRDPELADRLVPDCIYRGSCPELVPCNINYI
jgi:hypothetical protein